MRRTILSYLAAAPENALLGVHLKHVNIRVIHQSIRTCYSFRRWIEEIKRNTVVSVDHLTPSIALRLITKDCEIYHNHHKEPEKIFPDDPFWAFYWPGGQAITKYILDHPRVVKGKIILDIGSGCGASSIAAIKMGATRAVANDIDIVAGVAANLNASLNGVRIEVNATNFLDEPMETISVRPDVILVGDLCYDSDFSKSLFQFLRRMRESGTEIIVGDPGRHGLTSEILAKLQPLEKYRLNPSGCEENHGFGVVQVFRFK